MSELLQQYDERFIVKSGMRMRELTVSSRPCPVFKFSADIVIMHENNAGKIEGTCFCVAQPGRGYLPSCWH